MFHSMSTRARRAKVGEYIFDQLHRLGVRHTFGIPGDFALALYDPLERSKLTPVVVTHEPSAGFAADAYSRVTGLGVAVITYSVGGLNMLNSVGCAYAEKSPLVVVSGAPGLRERRQHELLHHKVRTYETQFRVYQEVTGYATVINNPLTACEQIQTALHTCVTRKRPVYIEVPRDMVNQQIEVFAPQFPPEKLDRGALREAVAEAVEMLNAAKRPVLMAGVETARYGLQRETIRLAERLAVPVTATALDKSAFPERHPQYIGVYDGAIGNPDVRRAVEDADCLVMLGTFLSDMNLGIYTAHLDTDRTIYATAERIQIKHHQYSNVGLGHFVQALLRARRLRSHKFRASDKFASLLKPTNQSRITVVDMFCEIDQFLEEDTIVVTDVGDCLFGALELRTKKRTAFLAPANYATMGFAVPGAIGAALAAPHRRVLAIVGDGGFQMTGMEVITAKKLGVNPIFVVMNNGEFITLKFMAPQLKSVDIPRVDYAGFANLFGGRGYAVHTRAEFRKALREARGESTFSILDVRLAPDDVSPIVSRLSQALGKRLKG
jgi:TPP-dependent 2-oxoacid decarboxylase